MVAMSAGKPATDPDNEDFVNDEGAKVDYADDQLIMLSRRRIYDDGEAEGDDGCGVPRNLVLDLSVNYAKK